MTKLKLDLQKAVKEIKRRKAKRVIIQLPEGLKTRAVKIVDVLKQKTRAEFVVIVDPCYGACDLAELERKKLKADLVVHLGHGQFLKSDFGKTVYVPLSYELDRNVMLGLVEELVGKLGKYDVKRVGLAATIQYLPYLDELKKELKKRRIVTLTAKGKSTSEGQVLGCDVSCAKKLEKKVSGFVFLGDGLFHPLAISFVSEKPVFVIDALNESVKELNVKEKEHLLKQRMVAIALAKGAKSFGLVVSTKEGQFRFAKALQLKKLIESEGRKVFLFAGDLLLPEYFLGVDVDCFVSTGCPRLVLEESRKWPKPLINALELEIALGKKKIENYEFEELA